MNIIRKTVAVIFILGSLTASAAGNSCGIDLSGLWRFQLDPMGFGMTAGSELYLARLPETIILPGSTDTGNKGIKNQAAYVDRLSRKHEYLGPAWYQREIMVPDDWNGKAVTLEFERCHWITTLYIDGKHIGAMDRLSAPDRWDLTGTLSPGVHTLTVCVDNRSPYPMDQWAHGITEYTQTNWNGITGQMRITARPASHISSLSLYPDVNSLTVKAIAKCNIKKPSHLTLNVTDPDGKSIVSRDIKASPGDSAIIAELPLGGKARMWDEFDPALYTVTATLHSDNDTDTCVERFGLRNVTQGKHHIRINGIDRHLRGTLDCAVWPLTGYPSTDKTDWERIMSTIKDYGMNHLRFHSWCPPEAAFEAADEAGIYLQIELPMWIKDVGRSADRRDWFEREMYAILDEYGNHPSFVLYCNGNENEGDFSVLEDLINKGREHDPRHLYSASTARTHTPSDQFYVSHISGKGWMTIYEGRPSTDWNINSGSDIDVPAIAHETGQRCMYPDFREMAKYTGVLEPRNMGVFRDRLTRNSMLHQAEDFFRATGAHTVLQYKAVNEALLSSDKSGGFQLLGLQDFPGQGSAYVGILDAFWESKGLVTPEEYRKSCAPQVILAGIPKRVFTPSEKLEAKVRIYNFGAGEIPGGPVRWHLDDDKGSRVVSGQIHAGKIARSCVDSVGCISTGLSALEAPGRFTLHLEKGDLHNSWDIWVMPDDDSLTDVSYVTDPDEALRRLEQGENVLLLPKDSPGRSTHFASHFWNPIMFNWDPMIVGTLINSDHAAFGSFPTDMFADWQWIDILENARTMDLTDITALTPVIQSIDTYEVNRKLGIAFEAAVGNGRLFVLCVDPDRDIDRRPASRRLIKSVAKYVGSDRFNPAVSVEPWQIKALFSSQDADKNHQTSDAVRQLLNQ